MRNGQAQKRYASTQPFPKEKKDEIRKILNSRLKDLNKFHS